MWRSVIARNNSIYFVPNEPSDDAKVTIMSQAHLDRIVQDPAILHGKPTIRGTRISVEVILEYLAQNPDFDALFADYPRLTLDDVKACFDYAHALVEATPRAPEPTAPFAR